MHSGNKHQKEVQSLAEHKTVIKGAKKENKKDSKKIEAAIKTETKKV